MKLRVILIVALVIAVAVMVVALVTKKAPQPAPASPNTQSSIINPGQFAYSGNPGLYNIV